MLCKVVLVNGGTASTSELLAGALHDAAGVLLIGEQTFGKGVTQRVVNLSDGSVLLVSTASYMTPKRMPVHKVQEWIPLSVLLSSDLNPEPRQQCEAVLHLCDAHVLHERNNINNLETS